jgi:hypothetical protein
MDFFIWNKQDTVMGLSANVLLNSRLDFLRDEVIVIHKKGDKRNVVMMETATSLRETYDIESNDPQVIGLVVSVILAQEDAETVREMLQKMDEDNKAKEEVDLVDEYTKLLDDLLIRDIENEMKRNDRRSIIPYIDAECNIIDLEDIESAQVKTLTVVLDHAFISEVSDVTELRCMSGFNEKLKELEARREKYANESDFASVEMITRQIDEMEDDILDSCDATLKIEATRVYQYENNVIIDCANGQTIIMDSDVVKSLKTSSIEYEKRDGKADEKYRVHYKTVDIKLSECYNEVKERGNTVFVISI